MNQRGRVTLKQVAARAGVAVATVGHILSNRGQRYGAATRAAVWRAAQETGYRRNAAARAVATGRFGCLSLLLSTNPGYSTLPDALVRGLQDALARRQMYLVVSTLPDQHLASEESMPSLLSDIMADGLLVNYRLNAPAGTADRIRRHRIPSVWINSKEKYDCTYPDDFAAACAATRCLLRAGHRRIAYVDCHYPRSVPGREPHFSEIDRERGYVAAMREARRAPVVVRPDDWLRQEEYVSFLERIFARPDPPTACVTYSDVTGLPLLYVANRHGLHTVEQFSVVTFCDQPLAMLGEQLRALVVPNRRMGDAAVEMLIEKIAAPAKRVPSRCVPFDLAAFQEDLP